MRFFDTFLKHFTSEFALSVFIESENYSSLHLSVPKFFMTFKISPFHSILKLHISRTVGHLGRLFTGSKYLEKYLANESDRLPLHTDWRTSLYYSENSTFVVFSTDSTWVYYDKKNTVPKRTSIVGYFIVKITLKVLCTVEYLVEFLHIFLGHPYINSTICLSYIFRSSSV